jgi:tripartite-type tricarboxylate transporter receptor subunit TctC
MPRRRALFLVSAAALPLPHIGTASAQGFPSRPLRVIVPFPAGGGVDLVGRAMSAQMERALGHPLVVENRPGNGGAVGIDIAARAAPDGHSILFVSGSFSLLPALRALPAYDPTRDFAPISVSTRQGYVFVVNAAHPARTLQEFVDMARRPGSRMTYGSAGSGGLGHLGMELLKSRTGMDMVHIPYRGGAQALNDLLGRRLDTMLATQTMARPQVEAGALRVLAVTTSGRAENFPNAPTIAEGRLTNLDDFELTNWYGFLAPARTPRPVVAQLEAQARAAVEAPEVRNRILADGSEPIGSTAAEMAEMIARDLRVWPPIIQALGARME